MERNYVAQDVFDVEIRRLDRQDGDTEARMKERLSYQMDRISLQLDQQGHELRTVHQGTQQQIDALSRQQSAMNGELRELKGEISGLKESIDSLKHFMTWGLTLIGLLVVIAQVLGKLLK